MEKKTKMIAQGLFELPDGDPTQGRLIGSRCGHCGVVSFPKRALCPNCLKDDLIETTPLSRRGTLYSFSVNRMAPDGFKAPYITGKVDLPEKVRIFSVISGVEPEEDALTIGQAMEVVFEPITKDLNGCDLVGYTFRPVRTAGQ